MKNIICTLATGIAIILFIPACNQNHQVKNSEQKQVGQDSLTPAKADKPASLTLLADTVTYDAIIHNPNPEDPYTEHFLKNLKKEKLIDGVFGAIYSGNMKAYNIFTGKEMTIAEVKEIEKAKGFTRAKVGKVQFTESWYMDEKSLSIKKKVIAMAFGYEHLNNEGVVDDYKGMFKVYIK